MKTELILITAVLAWGFLVVGIIAVFHQLKRGSAPDPPKNPLECGVGIGELSEAFLEQAQVVVKGNEIRLILSPESMQLLNAMAERMQLSVADCLKQLLRDNVSIADLRLVAADVVKQHATQD